MNNTDKSKEQHRYDFTPKKGFFMEQNLLSFVMDMKRPNTSADTECPHQVTTGLQLVCSTAFNSSLTIIPRRLILILLLGLIICPHTLKSQPEINLKQVADSCTQWANTGRLSEADSLCQTALKTAEGITDDYASANLFRVAGNLALQQHNYLLAEQHYQKALVAAEKLRNKEGMELKALAIFNYSLMYYEHGDFEKTLEMCFKARAILVETGNLKLLAEVDNRIGGTYINIRQNEKAAFYNRQAYQEALQSGDKEALCSIMNAYGNFWLQQRDTTEAIRLYSEAFKLASEINRPHIMSTAAYNLAYVYLEKADFNKALEYSRVAYKWGKAGNSLYDECDALYKIGLSYYYQEAFDVARDTLLIALDLAKKINSKTLQLRIYDALNCLEASSGNFEKGYEYLVYFFELSQEILSEKDQQQINFLEARYKDAQKQAEIRRLKHRVETGVTLIVILLLLLVLFFAYFRYRQRLSRAYRKAKEQEIRQLEQEKQLIATQALLKGETTERVRLSKDLHDGIGGMLSATKLKIANMKGNLTIPGEHVETFNTALNMLDNSIRELRRVAHNLMPESLMKYGLNPAIHDFCNSMENVSYHFYGSDRRLDEKFETSVYRIIQELVTNAVKHSGADQIHVQLIVEQDRVSLVVQDNGSGFDTSLIQHNKNGGLQNIRFRVASFGGHLDISSKPGVGTEINIEFNC